MLAELRATIEAIESVLRQDFTDFEVIVVDDGGSVALRSAIDERALTLDVTLVQQDNAGPGTARNTGARRARAAASRRRPFSRRRGR